MLMTDLGACEWFVWDLRLCNLVDRAQIDQVVGQFLAEHPGAEPSDLAAHFVAMGMLTEFQAERLLKGKTQGFLLGPYTIKHALGTGSMGTVYKAQTSNDSPWFAVKVIPRRSMWNVRLALRKVRAFEQCPHPVIVPFVDVGTAGGMHYLVWPFLEGEALERLIERQGKLGPTRVAALGVQVAEGLDAAHRAGLFHGLLKPSNLMIAPNGQVRILDFGIGCLLAESEGESLVDTMSTANSISSGLDCASPESITDPTNLDAVGDQYSLGCVLYYCLTGRYPFPDGTAIDKMVGHQHSQPTPIKDLVPDVPAGLLAVVEKLMEKVPTRRYGSATEVIEALTPFAVSAPPVPRPEPVKPVEDRPSPATPLREPPPLAPAKREAIGVEAASSATAPPTTRQQTRRWVWNPDPVTIVLGVILLILAVWLVYSSMLY